MFETAPTGGVQVYLRADHRVYELRIVCRTTPLGCVLAYILGRADVHVYLSALMRNPGSIPHRQSTHSVSDERRVQLGSAKVVQER